MNFYPSMPAPFPFRSDVHELHNDSGRPINIIRPAVLSAVMTATQNSCTVLDPRDGKPWGVNNNLVMVADSSLGKTATVNKLYEPIIQFQKSKNLETEHFQQQAKNNAAIRKPERRALERKLSKAIENDDKDLELVCREKLEQHLLAEPTAPQKVHYIQNGLSLSGMKRELSNLNIHPTYYIQEGVYFAGKSTPDTIGILNPGWNNEKIFIAGRYGKNDNVDIENPHFSTLILIQRKLHEKYFVNNEILKESGFNARCLIFIAEGPAFTGNPSERGRQVLKRINDRCIHLLENDEPRTLKLSEQAKHFWLRMVDDINHYKNLVDSKEAAAADFMGKYELHILRVASWLHLLYRDNDIIDTDCLYEANHIMQEALENYLRLFTDFYHPPALYQGAMDTYHWMITQAENGEITVRDINKNGPVCARNRAQLEKQLKLLEADGLIKRGKDRKSETIEILKYCSLTYVKY